MGNRSASVLFAFSCLLAARACQAIEIGQTAPVCQLEALAPQGPSYTDQFRGQVVYVDFWASWCAPCLKAFPFLNGLEGDLHARGLRIVGVNVDEDIADARAFLQQHAARFVVGSDAQGSCPRAFGVKGMPTSYLLDRKGVVRLIHSGFRQDDEAALRMAIEALLAEDGRSADPSAGVSAGNPRPAPRN